MKKETIEYWKSVFLNASDAQKQRASHKIKKCSLCKGNGWVAHAMYERRECSHCEGTGYEEV